MEEGVEGEVCRLQARACAEAVALDASVPRPGLTSVTRPRPGHEALGFIGLTGLAYEACLCSCRLGASLAAGWTGCWLRAVEEMARRWGNTGLGMLWLLALQSHAVGLAARHGREAVDEAVMGASVWSVEAEGVEGAAAFYRGLGLVSPGYLWRVSWSGLPDASCPGLAVWELRERGIGLAELARAAALYDPVMADTSGMLGVSLGFLYPLLLEEAGRRGLVEALRVATLRAALVYGDLLARRKLPGGWEGVAREAAGGSEVAWALLWRLLRGAGPGSAADLVAAAVARLLFLSWLGLVEAAAYPRQP